MTTTTATPRVHINRIVRDLDRAVTFYETLFGVAPTKRRADYANWRLDAPGLHLALVQGPKDAPTHHHDGSHFGVELFDDAMLVDWRTRVQQAGIETKIEENVACCYAVGDKFWVADPDGNEWEFWINRGDADRLASSANEDAATAGCCASTLTDEAQGSDDSACGCAPATAAVVTPAANTASEPCCGGGTC